MKISEEDRWLAECPESDCGWAKPTQSSRAAELLSEAHAELKGHATGWMTL